MTIAACYHSNEGVVFGTDSTVTVEPLTPKGIEITVRHFNHAQKIFEVGSNCSVGPMAISYYGLVEFGTLSQRTLIADFASEIESAPPASMKEVAERWALKVWQVFSSSHPAKLAKVQELLAIFPRTPEQEEELAKLRTLEAATTSVADWLKNI